MPGFRQRCSLQFSSIIGTLVGNLYKKKKTQLGVSFLAFLIYKLLQATMLALLQCNIESLLSADIFHLSPQSSGYNL